MTEADALTSALVVVVDFRDAESDVKAHLIAGEQNHQQTACNDEGEDVRDCMS